MTEPLTIHTPQGLQDDSRDRRSEYGARASH